MGPPPARSALKPARKPSVDERKSAERRRAAALVSRSKLAVRGLFADAHAGKPVRIKKVAAIVDAIAASVAYNPQTLLRLTRLKNKDEYTYLHSMAVCTLMVSVAQHLGLDDAKVRELGLAGLLHDIGKTGIPEEILNKQGGLTDEEFQNVRAHPEHGYQLLSTTPEIPQVALDVCRHHHEKTDGSGYPFGLPNDAISFAARLGAICDVYDALTSDRAYKQAWSPEKAIDEMWSWEGHFDREILFSFMQAIEVYPPGMLVRLRSDELGMMLERSPRSTRPNALAFYSIGKGEFIESKTMVISRDPGREQVVSPEDPASWGFDNWAALRERLSPGIVLQHAS